MDTLQANENRKPQPSPMCQSCSICYSIIPIQVNTSSCLFARYEASSVFLNSQTFSKKKKKKSMCKQHWAWKCRLLIVISGKHVHLHIHELIQSCCSSTEEEMLWLQVSSIDVPIKYRKPNKILFRFDIKMLLGDLTISVNESKLGQRFSGLSDQMSVSGVYADVCLARLKPNRSTLLF